MVGPRGFGSSAARALARNVAEHQALFAATGQLIPSLKGQVAEAGAFALLRDGSGQDVAPQTLCGELYAHWQQAHPETGPAYWLTRSWGMLCWQPIYLAMVAVYRLGAVPALHRMGQGYQAGMVSGFVLPLDPMLKGDAEQLIAAAGERLQGLWQALFEAFSAGQRLRPGFVRPLLADDLLAALVRVPDFFPEVSPELVDAHAPLWLAACALPVEHLAGWRSASASTPVVAQPYIRQRCCLHYKRRDGVPCDNCPRQQGSGQCCRG